MDKLPVCDSHISPYAPFLAGHLLAARPPSPPHHELFPKNSLHSSAISKHICANICVRCIDLQNIAKVKAYQILLVSQNIGLKFTT